jgi:hypothetical protein
MVALFDLALGLGCSCCTGYATELPDICCHKCKKVLYTTREQPSQAAPPREATSPGD